MLDGVKLEEHQRLTLAGQLPQQDFLAFLNSPPAMLISSKT
jgi:hypothetical protein